MTIISKDNANCCGSNDKDIFLLEWKTRLGDFLSLEDVDVDDIAPILRNDDDLSIFMWLASSRIELRVLDCKYFDVDFIPPVCSVLLFFL